MYLVFYIYICSLNTYMYPMAKIILINGGYFLKINSIEKGENFFLRDQHLSIFPEKGGIDVYIFSIHCSAYIPTIFKMEPIYAFF